VVTKQNQIHAQHKDDPWRTADKDFAEALEATMDWYAQICIAGDIAACAVLYRIEYGESFDATCEPTPLSYCSINLFIINALLTYPAMVFPPARGVRGLRGLPGRLAEGCSFSGDTEVLMAGGTTKPIEDVQVGDDVLATDPVTGERGPRKVTELWVHDDQVFALQSKTVSG
jgi:hypothetical protein